MSKIGDHLGELMISFTDGQVGMADRGHEYAVK